MATVAVQSSAVFNVIGTRARRESRLFVRALHRVPLALRICALIFFAAILVLQAYLPAN